jgi:hypothetical protein
MYQGPGGAREGVGGRGVAGRDKGCLQVYQGLEAEEEEGGERQLRTQGRKGITGRRVITQMLCGEEGGRDGVLVRSIPPPAQ